MYSNRNQSNFHIRGDGNVLGDNNVINSRQESHYHKHQHKHSSASTNDEDAKGIAGGLIFILLVAVWTFVRHASEIYFYLGIGTVVALVPYLMLAIFGIFSEPPERKHMIAMAFGSSIAILAFFLIQSAQGSMDPKLIQFSQEANNAWVFWSGLTPYGRDLVVGNMVGAAFISVSIFFAFLMGCFVLVHYLLDSNLSSDTLLRILMPFRPNRGGIFAAVMLAASWAFTSGYVFQFLKQS